MAHVAIALFQRSGGLLLALFALLMAGATTPVAQAQSRSPAVADSVWYGTYQYSGEGLVTFDGLRFNRDGSVEGMPLMRGNWEQRGNRVIMDHGDSVPDFVMIGTISGDSMNGTFSHGAFRGTFSVQRGYSERSARPAPASTVAGTSWFGQYQHRGEAVTQFESLTFNADGTVSGMPLMAGNWVQNGNRVTMDHGDSVPDFVMEGTVTGDTMSGTFSYLGGDYRGTFTVRLGGSAGGVGNVVLGGDTFWRGQFNDMDYAMILHADRTVSLAFGGDMATGSRYADSEWRLNGDAVEFRLYSTEPFGYRGRIRGDVFAGTWEQGNFQFRHDPSGGYGAGDRKGGD